MTSNNTPNTNKTAAAQAAHDAAVKAAQTVKATTVEPGSNAEAIGELAKAAAQAANNQTKSETAAAAEALQSEAAKLAAAAAVHASGARTGESIANAVDRIQGKGRIRSFIGRHKILTSAVGLAVIGGVAYGVRLYLKKHVEIEVNL